MTTYLTILTTPPGQIATKSFVREHGAVIKLPMRMARHFTVERRPVETIYDLANVLSELSSASRKLVIRGEPLSAVDCKTPVRRLKHDDTDGKATFQSSTSGQRWVCLDFDNVRCPDGVFPARDFENAMIYLRDFLPPEFQDVTFWAQLSSSAGIHGWDTMSAHLWFMLDRPIADDQLNAWASQIAAPVDPRLFNAVQPHFTASPIFAYDVIDPCPVRYALIEGTRDVVCLDLCKADDPERITDHSRNARRHAERTRTQDRTIGTTSRPRDPAMGSGRCEDPRPSQAGAAIYVQRPLLSEWLSNCFRPKTS